MSKEELGSVIGLCVSREQKREKTDSLHVELDGVKGDKFKGKDINRSVLLVCEYSYQLAKENSIKLSCGELGENILLDFNPYSFEAGTKLQIGEVLLEISQKSSLCPSLSKISSKLPKLLKDKRGVFTKVINPGIIHSEDSIYLVS